MLEKDENWCNVRADDERLHFAQSQRLNFDHLDLFDRMNRKAAATFGSQWHCYLAIDASNIPMEQIARDHRPLKLV
jgi:hypothetical protein